MRKFLFTLSLFFSTCLLPWLGSGGCQSTGVTSNSSDTEILEEPASLLTKDNGGYSSEDEVSRFGLESMNQYTADEEASDPSVSVEDEAKAVADPGAQVYRVRIVWGNLALNARDEIGGDEETDVIHWGGSLSYDGAATLLLDKTILFEKNDLILDEADPTVISWDSITGPHVDGILATLIVTPGTGGDALTFGTKALEHTIPLADLDRYNEIVTLDEDGHGVAFTALRIDDDGDCAEGFLEGKYHDRTDGHDGGIFRGRVLTDEGELNGHVRGHYGVNGDGDQVFFGKYINVDGLFRGFLRGTYGDGAMAGDWILSDETVGTLAAKYVQGETVDSGFFQGYWETTCE